MKTVTIADFRTPKNALSWIITALLVSSAKTLFFMRYFVDALHAVQLAKEYRKTPTRHFVNDKLFNNQRCNSLMNTSRRL